MRAARPILLALSSLSAGAALAQSHPLAPVVKTGAPTTGPKPVRHSAVPVQPGAGGAARPVVVVSPRHGGFVARRQPTLVAPDAVTVLVFSPYANGSVEVPSNPIADNPNFPACQSVQECGDGLLGHGAVCDRLSLGLGAGDIGQCREACRTDDDCAAGQTCSSGLDPDEVGWSGCLAAVP